MNYPWKELSPKDSFLIQKTQFITDIDKNVVTLLYQPIIGPQAYSLYMTLLAEVENGSYQSPELLHAELLTLLGMGIPEFYQARIRLEGIGLLHTYLKQEPEKSYVYQPAPPLSSEAFFKEDLLRLLLLEHVGEKQYTTLQNRFSIKKLDQTNVEEITKSFLDVYHFAPSAHQPNEAQLDGNRTYVKTGEGTVPNIQADGFNFSYLKDLMQREFFSPEALTKELKHSVQVLHNLYGIDEVEMSQYLLRATNLETGKVDADELTKTVAESYGNTGRPGRRLTDKVEVQQQRTEEEKEQRKKQLEQAGYSASEVKLILLSEKRTPYAFITNIKKQKKGKVTESERLLLNRLMEQYNLTPAILNILIYYALVIQDHSKLGKDFAETLADNWMQAEVVTPEQAIEQTKMFVGKVKAATEKRKENRANRYYGKNVVRKVEKLPEWAKDEQQPVEEEMMSEDMQKEFMERLKRFREKGKAGDE